MPTMTTVTGGFQTASSLHADRVQQRHASTAHFNSFANCGESDALPRTDSPSEFEITRISSLIDSGCYDEATRIARQFSDKSIARFVDVACEKMRIHRWRSREGESGIGILPTRESVLRAGDSGDDILCAQLLGTLYAIPRHHTALLSKDDARELIVRVCQHWMIRTANKLREIKALECIDIATFGRMLDHSFLPLARYVASTAQFSSKLRRASAAVTAELRSRYAHCGLRFCIRFSKDLETLREECESDHIVMLSADDFVGFCRYRKLLAHMDDNEIIGRRAMIRSSGNDTVSSARLFSDLVAGPWSERFRRMFDTLFAARVPPGADRENLRQFIELRIPLPVARTTAVDEASMAA